MTHRPITQFIPVLKQVSLEELTDKKEDYPLRPFDERTILFLNDLSKLLLSNREFNRFSEVAALGYWLRKSNILRFKEENRQLLNSDRYIVSPLGRVFHIAPSNVDTIFLYSVCISLLMGNKNTVRISSSMTPVMEFIMQCLGRLLSMEENKLFGEYVSIVTYEHSDEINRFFSARCNGRVIWGGNQTVSYFKQLGTSPYCKDIYFPGRISFAAFKADEYLRLSIEQKQELARKFYNDAYVFDQKGCSSPVTIYLVGNEREKEIFAKDFYSLLSDLARQQYLSQASALSTKKLNALVSDVIEKKVKNVQHENSTVYLVEVDAEASSSDTCGGGYFYLKCIPALESMKKDISESVQTLSHFGFTKEELRNFCFSINGLKIDRIVPIGEALQFHYIWDGMNLFETLSSKRYLKD